MNKKIILFTVIFVSILYSCNNETNHQHNPATEGPQTKEDSLYRDIMAAHDAAMPKIGKLKGYQKTTEQQLDSISKLKGKEQQMTLSYKNSLDSLLESLQYADMAMDTWMTEFVPDSLSDKMELRIQYLESEKMKATKMKDNVLSSIEKAKEILKQ